MRSESKEDKKSANKPQPSIEENRVPSEPMLRDDPLMIGRLLHVILRPGQELVGLILKLQRFDAEPAAPSTKAPEGKPPGEADKGTIRAREREQSPSPAHPVSESPAPRSEPAAPVAVADSRPGDVPAALNQSYRNLDLEEAVSRIWPEAPHVETISVDGAKVFVQRNPHYILVGRYLFIPTEEWNIHKQALHGVRDYVIVTPLERFGDSPDLNFIWVHHTLMSVLLMQRFSHLISGKTFLDAGCGEGVLCVLA